MNSAYETTQCMQRGDRTYASDLSVTVSSITAAIFDIFISSPKDQVRRQTGVELRSDKGCPSPSMGYESRCVFFFRRNAIAFRIIGIG